MDGSMIVKAPIPKRCARYIHPPEYDLEGGNSGQIDYWGRIKMGDCPVGGLNSDGQQQHEFEVSPSPYPDAYMLGVARCVVVVVVVVWSESVVAYVVM